MAEGDESQQKRTLATATSDDSSSDVDALDLDLVSTGSDRVPKRGAPDAGMPDQGVRKDDNPFSFRHFLNTADRSYHNQGARPKVYCEGRPVSIRPPNDVEISDVSSVDQHMSSRIVSEYPSALPDFVQDHLVIEQCYLNKNIGGTGVGGTFAERSENLPDCTLERSERDRDRSGRPDERSFRRQAEFPLDLPLAGEPQSRSSPQVIVEVGSSQSLPDFLADTAPITSAVGSGVGIGGTDNDGTYQPPTEWEADRLRLELENTRRQLAEKTRLAECLTHELDMARSKNHEYTQNLTKAWEQVEENLERSKIRASSSENNIMKLRQEVNLLNKEINRLKRDNMALRNEEGAIGGPGVSGVFSSGFDSNAQRHVAQDLRAAASTAEHSLRQLLSGVENLRLLASRVETLSNYEEQRASYISDEDADDDANAGPAL